MNDSCGVRINTFMSLLSMAIIAPLFANFDSFGEYGKLAFLIAAQSGFVWSRTSIFFGGSSLFGLYAGGSVQSYTRTAALAASILTIPFLISGFCVNSEQCSQIVDYCFGGLLAAGAITCLWLNPLSLVDEPTDVHKEPRDREVMSSK